MTVVERPEIRTDAEARSGVSRPVDRSWVLFAERFGLEILFVGLIVTFAVLVPETFPTYANARLIVTGQSAVAVAALALLFPLTAGRFDISVGGIVGMSAIATAAAMANYGLGLPVAVAIGVGSGVLIGCVNGFLVAFLGIDSIICTIGTATILGGLIAAYTKGIPISTGLSPTLTDLGITSIAGVPALFVIMLVIALACGLILRQSVYGRDLRAVGSNESAALLIGLNVRSLVMCSFVISGTLGGIAGVLYVAGYGNASPEVGGLQFLLPALAAVFLGATTLFPGVYNVPGTIVALFFVATAVSGLTLLGVDSWITDVFNGAAVIVAVGLAAMLRRRRTGSAVLGE